MGAGLAARPAETGGIAGAVALLAGHLFGITDAATLTAIGVLVGCVPASITWAVVRLERRTAKRNATPVQ